MKKIVLLFVVASMLVPTYLLADDNASASERISDEATAPSVIEDQGYNAKMTIEPTTTTSTSYTEHVRTVSKLYAPDYFLDSQYGRERRLWLNQRNVLVYSAQRSRSGDQEDVLQAGDILTHLKIVQTWVRGEMRYVFKIYNGNHACGNRVTGFKINVQEKFRIENKTVCITKTKTEIVYVPAPPPPPQIVYVQQSAPCPPQSRRYIRLAAGGIPTTEIERVKTTRLDTEGFFGGIATIIGQAVRRPSRIEMKQFGGGASVVNNNANANTNVNSNSQNTVVNNGSGSANGTSAANGTGKADANSGGKPSH